MRKSGLDEIRKRFDPDVERFSNLETGQSATVDAPLALEPVADAAAAATPDAERLLDAGGPTGKQPFVSCLVCDRQEGRRGSSTW